MRVQRAHICSTPTPMPAPTPFSGPTFNARSLTGIRRSRCVAGASWGCFARQYGSLKARIALLRRNAARVVSSRSSASSPARQSDAGQAG